MVTGDGRKRRRARSIAASFQLCGLGQLGESRLGRVINSESMGAHFNVVHMDVPGDHYLDLAALAFVYTVQTIPPDAGPRW